MKSFGRLLKRMRGQTPRRELAQRAGVSYGYIAGLETGRAVATEARARQVLRRGLGLREPDISRLLLGVQLYDAGLKDNELRQLVIDLVRGDLHGVAQEQLRGIYRSYAGRD